MKPKLTTQRLDLRSIQLEDLELAHDLWTNAEVRRFLFDDRVISLDEARALIEASLKNFEEHGYGLWFTFSREAGALVGFAGFIASSDESPNLVYGIRPEFCGHGFATEAAKAVLDYAFETLALSSVKADVDEPNAVSVRILEKLEMTQIRRGLVDGRPLLYYEKRAKS